MDVVIAGLVAFVFGFVGGYGACFIRERQAAARERTELTAGLQTSLDRVGEIRRMLNEALREK